jgi:hypothetical protein
MQDTLIKQLLGQQQSNLSNISKNKRISFLFRITPIIGLPERNTFDFDASTQNISHGWSSENNLRVGAISVAGIWRVMSDIEELSLPDINGTANTNTDNARGISLESLDEVQDHISYFLAATDSHHNSCHLINT